MFVIFLPLFCALNAVSDGVPLSLGLYVGATLGGGPLLPLGLGISLAFLPFGKGFEMALGAWAFIILSPIFYLYRKKNRRPKVETVLYIFAVLAPYVLIENGVPRLEKLAYTPIITLFCFVAWRGSYPVFLNDHGPFKDSHDRIFASLLWLFLAVGIIRFFGKGPYFCLSLFLTCLGLRYGGKAPSPAVPVLFGLPLYLVYRDGEMLLFYLVLYGLWTVFYTKIHLVNALILCLGTVAAKYLFYSLPAFSDGAIGAGCAGLAMAAILPEGPIKSLKQKMSFDPKEVLMQNLVFRQRLDMSAKFYELSNTFYQIQDGLLSLKKTAKDPQAIVDKIVDEVIFNMCQGCSFRERCTYKSLPKRSLVEKIIRVGIVKGRVTLIDVPKDFTDLCGFPNSVVYEVNRLIGQYCEYIQAAESSDSAKEILALQSKAVGSAIKNLAFKTAEKLNENTSLKKRILRALFLKGIYPEGLIVFGEDEDTDLYMVTKDIDPRDERLVKAVSAALGFEVLIKSASEVSGKRLFLRIGKKPPLDAAFGVSKVTKTHSPASGDCHTLVKLDEKSFLVALSDGMGSGEAAENTSKTAISLIEALYKGGLDGEFIMDFSNRLLSLMVDDSFAAVDIGVISLESGKASFIKIGAPYGFILSDKGVRFIEGTSLPLGILDEVKPTTATADLSPGDVVLMVSDGVTDAFGSSGELLDFLKAAPLLNPQALSDSVVERALNLCGRIAEDDMTALAVRIL